MAKAVRVILLGPGLVGRAVLQQLRAIRRRDVAVVAVANARAIVEGDDADALVHGRAFTLTDLPALAQRHAPCVLIDCTAAQQVGEYYPTLLKYAHVVTPNKKAFSGQQALWHAIMGTADKMVGYESTVGAGLPVISTLLDLVATGDEVLSIEGVLSGTLSFLFNAYCASDKQFSEIVMDAKQRGYTEPDPRDDLSGMDVGRKCCILARTIGLELVNGVQDVVVESLVPQALGEAGADAPTFLRRLAEFDDHWSARRARAKANGCVLRYVASISRAGCQVALRELPVTHALAHLEGSDNAIVIRTRRWPHLIIQGPGAGAEVTAHGVVGDLLRIVRVLTFNQ